MSRYSGPERRRNRVMVTRHTAYHLRDRLCVGARDGTGQWHARHRTVGSELLATVDSDGRWFPYTGDSPSVGTRLLFSNDTLTSPLEGIERAPLETVRAHYPEPGTTGEFAARAREDVTES